MSTNFGLIFQQFTVDDLNGAATDSVHDRSHKIFTCEALA
jgi:hypothetical protein